MASESVSLFCCFGAEAILDDVEECTFEKSFVRLVVGVLFLFAMDAEEFSDSEALLADDE